MKKKLILFSLILSTAFSQDFFNVLPKLGVDVFYYKSFTPISRYDLVRLLNFIDCFDCFHPTKRVYEKYNFDWWQQFKKKSSSNFEDIYYKSTFYNKKDYYYCIVYAADKGYIHGYPKNLSHTCPGKFCGLNYASYADLIQVLTNIVASRLYDKYYVNWKDILDWYNTVPKDNILKQIFNEEDLENIKKGINKCKGNRCKINSPSELGTYLKYCTFNLKECGFESFSRLSEGERPIAQVNFLLQNNIISEKDIKNIKSFSKAVPKEVVLNIISKVKNVIKCEFNLDYDNDGILNKDDNCIYIYNPLQKDTDKDNIGDVCDDDIDGDGKKNPVGVVDDRGNIILSKLLDGKDRDNCIFMSNFYQEDVDHNGIGDACQRKKDIIALQIKANYLGGTLPVKVNFLAEFSGNLRGIDWYFGDGDKGRGVQITHNYKKAGIYNVIAYGQFKDGTTKPVSLTVILNKFNSKYGLQIYCEPLIGFKPLKMYCRADTKGDIKKIRWIFDNKETKEVDSNKPISKIYLNEGHHIIFAQGLDEEGKVVATSKLNIGVNSKFYEDYIGSYFIARQLNSLNGKKVLFNTKIENFKVSDVKEIYWDFGDGIKLKNKEMKMLHFYQKSGVYNVKQKIVLFDGRILDNSITVVVKGDTYSNKQKSVSLVSNKLIANVGDKICYHIILNNLSLSEISFVKWYFEDINSSLSFNSLNKNLEIFHTFYHPGSFRVKVILYTKDGKIYESSLIQGVKGLDICSVQEYKKLNCDMDYDGIPDVCDDDIDGDGIPNFVGLVIKETHDCKIDMSIINKTLLAQQREIILKNYNKGEKIQFDNCPFVYNPDQKDSNLDGKGDVCDNEERYRYTDLIKNDFGLLIGNSWIKNDNIRDEKIGNFNLDNVFLLTR